MVEKAGKRFLSKMDHFKDSLSWDLALVETWKGLPR